MVQAIRRQRRVKIAATLGPASSTIEEIRALFVAGADVFRLNMSHSSKTEIERLFYLIREVETELSRPICVMADLQGPKLRCGFFSTGFVELSKGSFFRFDLNTSPGCKSRVCLPHKEIFDCLEVGSVILVDDGKIRLEVVSCGSDYAETKVVVGGRISDKKGVNIPDVVLPVGALSKKDKLDLEFVCTLGVDWLALSFVQRPADVKEARQLAQGRVAILSKIEKPVAVSKFEEILDVSDGIMIARGDLGVELPVEAVPPIQKRLVRQCRARGKAVIVATQMMESMVNSPVPTRAEVSDVAQAIYEGADAVMLSAESAVGNFPVQAVATMDRVAVEVERDPNHRQVLEAARTPSLNGVSDAITVAAREVAETTNVKAICCFTHSGTTALLASRERPRVPIIALTPKINIARRLSLNWGLHCVITSEVARFKMAVANAAKEAKHSGFASNSDKIVVIAGIPFNIPGTTNILRVAHVDEKSLVDGELD